MRKVAGYALAVALCSILSMAVAGADAATVSGTYSNRSGTPLAGHQLHFENQISGDIFLTLTGPDGSFSADLPPGIYDLRAERGLVLYRGLQVDGGAVNVGRVEDGAPLDVRKPFEREGIAPSMVDTAAPATAHLHENGTASAQPAQSAGQATAPSAQATPQAAATAAASAK